ncbi:hypothetical protein [Microbacterium sp.]|uniref:hypothetical protein n=1 Tax=Microbacterium sp. TaxID=51671 RepID=UPI0039196E8E
MSEPVAPRASTLHWWAVAAAIAALTVPVPTAGGSPILLEQSFIDDAVVVP